MATPIDNPNGFVFLKSLVGHGETEMFTLTTSQTIARGDALEFVPSTGRVKLATATSSSIHCIAAEPEVTVGSTATIRGYPAYERNIFAIQVSGTFAATMIGNNYDIEGTTGIMEVNENATATEVVQIVGYDPNDDIGANTTVYVRIAKSSYGTNAYDGDVRQGTEHGAGAIGTAFAPRTYRRTEPDGTIVKTIEVDLTGLAVVGTAAKDAIGLAAGGAAYLGRYVTATDGICYRIEMLCVEAPGEGTATITQDIDLGAEDIGTTAYDGPVDDIIVNTAALVAGEVVINNAPALTANDYIYLIEGDTAATTGVYNAGQYIIRFYGHPVLA